MKCNFSFFSLIYVMCNVGRAPLYVMWLPMFVLGYICPMFIRANIKY